MTKPKHAEQQEWLLMLGASADQVFAIRTAQGMGFYVVAADVNPDSPGFQIADQSALVSIRDIPALIGFINAFKLQGHRVSGVLVQGSDIPQVGCALAAHIGSPSIPMESAHVSTHKYKMKCRFQERGVTIPWFSLVESTGQLKRIVIERGYPLIIKPVDRSVPRGVLSW